MSAMGTKSTLNMYRSKEKPRYEGCYDGSWGSSLLFKARTGSLEVNARTYRFNGRGNMCEWCEGRENETVAHLVIECEGHEYERGMLIGNLKEVLGEEKWEVVKTGEDRGMAVLLGLEDKIRRICTEEERQDVLRCMKRFLEGVWVKR